MKIRPFVNGERYGWSRARSLFDFFFPYSKDWKHMQEYVRAEGLTAVRWWTVSHREFYTFRCFAWTYLYILAINPVRYWRGSLATVVRYSPAFAAALLAYYMGRKGMLSPFAVMGVIAFDNGTYNNATGTSGSFTMHAVTGSNAFMGMGARPYSTTNNGDCLSDPTYNSVAMTRKDYTSGGSNTSTRYYMYALPNPASGAQSLAWSSSQSLDGGLGAIFTTYSGCKNAQPEAASSGLTTNSSSVTASVTPATIGAWVIGYEASSDSSGSVGTATSARNVANSTKAIESTSNPISSLVSTTLTFSGISTNPLWTNWMGVMSIAPFPVSLPTMLRSIQAVHRASSY